MKPIRLTALVAALVTFAMGAVAQNAAPPTRLRGAIEAVDGNVITIKTREGATEKVTMADNWAVNLVVPITMADIKKDSFVGIASMKAPDGSMNALEVLVFPEAMRGRGEGHYDWDLMPESKMTNAAVTAIVESSSAQTLTLTYKTGSQTINVKPGTPIVTFQPGKREDAKVGAKLLVTATKAADGSLTAAGMAVGKDGFTPPM